MTENSKEIKKRDGLISKTFKHISIAIIIFSAIYTIIYFLASLYDLEWLKYAGNFLFAGIAFVAMLISRKKPLSDNEQREKEWNFSLSFCAFTIAIIDPVAKFMTSEYGLNLIGRHYLGLKALFACLLAFIVMFIFIAIGVKTSEK